MASEPAIPAARFRLLRRVLRVGSLVGLAVILTVAGSFFFALGSAGATRWIFEQIVVSSNYRLSVERLSGSLWSGLAIGGLRFEEGDTRIEAQDLRLRFDWRALLYAQLAVAQLSADQLTIELPELTPAGPERSGTAAPGWGLPPVLGLRVEALSVNRIELSAGAVQRHFEGFRLSGESIRGGFQVEFAEVKSAGLQLRLEDFAISVRAPFEVAGRVVVETDLAGLTRQLGIAPPKLDPGERLRLDSIWSGPVDQLLADVVLEAWGTRLETRIQWRPLESLRRAQLTGSVRGFAPQRISSAWPHALIDGQFELDLEAMRFGLDLRNAMPGTLDRRALPFESLALSGRIEDGRLGLSGIVASLPDEVRSASGRAPAARDGPAARQGRAQLKGDLDIDWGRTIRLLDGSFPAVRGRFSFDGVDPTALLTTLPRGSVSGHVRVDGASVSGRIEDRGLAAGPLSLDAALRLSDTDLHIEHARLELLESRLIASGRLHGDALRRIDLSGRFEQLDPRVVGLLITGSPALPEGHLNGRLRLASPGGVSGPFTFGLDLDRGSRLAEQLLTGSASGEWAAGRVRNVDLRLSQGGDRLTARGSLGSVSDRMEIDISIADLTRFDSRLEGAAALSGDLSGAFDSPEVRLRLSAGSVKGSSSGSAAKAQPRVEASVQGTLARHALSAQLSVRGERLSFAGEGAWSSITGSWESRIDRLEMAGTLPAKSERAFDVVLGAGRAELRGLELAVSAGVARLDRLAWQNGVLTSSGQLVEVSLAPLADSLAQTPSAGAQGDAATREAIARLRNLRLIAQWQLEGPDWRTLSGKAGVEVRRDPLAPGEQGQAPVFVDSRMSLSLQEGRIDGTARLSVPSLAFSRRLTAPDWVAEGALSFDGRIRGTVERPELDGTLKGERLMLANRSLGWRLRDGRLDARFDGRRLRVESLRFSSGGSGGIELQGDIEPAASSGPSLSGRAQAAGIEPGGRAPFDADLALRLDSFTLPLGPGQRLLMSGATRLVARDGAVYWSGSVRADEGLIEFRSGGAPELPADLVIVDRRRPAARPASNSLSQPPAADAQRGGWSPVVQADLRVAMGERLRVQGGGLDARLTGELALSGRLPRDPRVQGRLQLREGHFTAYGRKLELTRGEVRFNGELDNPSLDIVAMRRNPEVSAGVAVTGPARSPRIRLTSEPEVPDAQKLSWLVLGTGLEDAAGAGQALALREAALTLLGDDDGGLAGGLSQALGLDAIGFGRAAASPSTALERARLAPPGMPAASASATSTGSLREEVVSVSKRLNSRLTVSYERGIQGLWNLVRLQYEISNRLSLRAQSGSENAIDLLYFWWFD